MKIDEQVTAERVEASIKAAGITMISARDCSICRQMMYYEIDGDQVTIDTGCGCVRYSNVQPSSFHALARWINSQTNPEVKKEIAAKMGLTMEIDDD